jgi:hypothetical protein
MFLAMQWKKRQKMVRKILCKLFGKPFSKHCCRLVMSVLHIAVHLSCLPAKRAKRPTWFCSVDKNSEKKNCMATKNTAVTSGNKPQNKQLSRSRRFRFSHLAMVFQMSPIQAPKTTIVSVDGLTRSYEHVLHHHNNKITRIDVLGHQPLFIEYLGNPNSNGKKVNAVSHLYFLKRVITCDRVNRRLIDHFPFSCAA